MARREFLQLADHYDPRKHDVAGWFVSEKLDGTRCFWDGGLTRGLPTEQVPWASRSSTPRPARRKPRSSPWQPACGAATAIRSWPRTGGSTSFPAVPWTASCGPGGASSNSAGRSAAATPRTSASTRSSSRSTPPRRWARSSAPARSRTPTWSATSITSRLRRGFASGSIRGAAASTGVPVPKRCLGDDFKFLTADQTVRQGTGRAQRGPGKHRRLDLLPPSADEADRHSRRGRRPGGSLPATGAWTRAARAW